MAEKIVILIHAETDKKLGQINNAAWKQALSIPDLTITKVQIAAEPKVVKGKRKEGTRTGAGFGKSVFG